MVFGKKFFIILFTGFGSFVMLQIIFRKIYGLDMISFTDLMNFFGTFSYKNFQFDDALVNLVHTVVDFTDFAWEDTDSVVGALFNIWTNIRDSFTHLWIMIVAWFNTWVAFFKDVLYVIGFVKDFFVFLFT